ncbi:MAG TPA: hypothetical protein VGM39_22240 [Kofleriaceae bacterium]|jgi:hypothetical protein
MTSQPVRVLAVALAGLLAASASAHAAVPTCESLPGTKVYLQVGDTQVNLLKRLGRALRDNSTKQLTIVWYATGSCTNITAIYSGVPYTSGQMLDYVPSVADDATWDPKTSATLKCTAPATPDALKVPDIANSALFNSACTSTPAKPATVKLSEGPKQAYVLAVPKASTQTAITYEEAYFVFGFGQSGMISPWENETQLFIRTLTKSTLLAWAANISVPAAKFKGVQRDQSTQVVTDLTTTQSPELAIGILGVEVYDGLRAQLKTLAFRAKNQKAAYFPDSSPTSTDKKNVRDGHYTVWSPTIWMDTTTNDGETPVNADARYVIDLIRGIDVTPAPMFNMVEIISAVGLVPDCAMGVRREYEGGPFTIYHPTESCVCKYESVVDHSSCATCSATQACTTGVCRAGFCEVQ